MKRLSGGIGERGWQMRRDDQDGSIVQEDLQAYVGRVLDEVDRESRGEDPPPLTGRALREREAFLRTDPWRGQPPPASKKPTRDELDYEAEQSIIRRLRAAEDRKAGRAPEPYAGPYRPSKPYVIP